MGKVILVSQQLNITAYTINRSPREMDHIA